MPRAAHDPRSPPGRQQFESRRPTSWAPQLDRPRRAAGCGGKLAARLAVIYRQWSRSSASSRPKGRGGGIAPQRSARPWRSEDGTARQNCDATQVVTHVVDGWGGVVGQRVGWEESVGRSVGWLFVRVSPWAGRGNPTPVGKGLRGPAGAVNGRWGRGGYISGRAAVSTPVS